MVLLFVFSVVGEAVDVKVPTGLGVEKTEEERLAEGDGSDDDEAIGANNKSL